MLEWGDDVTFRVDIHATCLAEFSAMTEESCCFCIGNDNLQMIIKSSSHLAAGMFCGV
ncbi:hypothetical protein ACSF6V_01265 [Escherichia coli]|uniref:hypothetical protein n=1 Tax=Escherichia coli TaxID=562 RepID=UPI003EEC3D8F